MNLVTRGYGKNSKIITRGYGIFEIIVSQIKYFTSAIISVKRLLEVSINIKEK